MPKFHPPSLAELRRGAEGTNSSLHDELADFAQPAGDLDVFLEGRGIAAGMVVNKKDGGGAVAYHLSVDVAGMDDARAEGAFGDEHVTKLAVLVVEEHRVEVFDGLAREALAEVGVDVGGAAEGRAGDEFLFAEAFGEFQKSGEALDGGGLRRREPRTTCRLDTRNQGRGDGIAT